MWPIRGLNDRERERRGEEEASARSDVEGMKV